jgi:hypothetical protein
MMDIRQTSRGISILFYAVMVALALFAGIMFIKVLPYLSFDRMVNFLSTKTDETLDNTVFRIGFYIHITSSWFVLAAGIPQFIPAISTRFVKFHRLLGKIYVVGILAFAAASGLVLAVYANGGLPAKTGFIMQCIVWWLVTYMAYRKVLKKNYREHIIWMIRSFAITLAAFSLRTETYLMHYLLDTKPIETYITITWLSWVGNLLIAEILIAGGLDKYLYQQIIKPRV